MLQCIWECVVSEVPPAEASAAADTVTQLRTMRQDLDALKNQKGWSSGG